MDERLLPTAPLAALLPRRADDLDDLARDMAARCGSTIALQRRLLAVVRVGRICLTLDEADRVSICLGYRPFDVYGIDRYYRALVNGLPLDSEPILPTLSEEDEEVAV